MNIEMQNTYASYIEKKELLKNLTTELNTLKKKIITYHGDKEIICEDGFQSKITQCTMNTPIVEAIEKKFNIVLTPDCFKTTKFSKLGHVKKMILG